MNRGVVTGLLVVLSGLPARHANAQSASLDSVAEHTSRQSLARYSDRRAAVADGYRRVGTDFPGMGEHWLHVGALLSGSMDPARPTLLVYATIDGRPTLLGAGFITITRGDSVADGVPGWPDAWHEHSGLLSDESGARPNHASPGTRVWVLHVWTALENPAGPFAPDNWALPFARLGVRVPPGVEADAGRAAGLLVGGDTYLREVLTAARLRQPESAGGIDAAIADARSATARIVTRLRDAGHSTAADAAELRNVWHTLAVALQSIIGAPVAAYMAPPHNGHRRAQ